jgi:hypothetical protein
MDLDMVSVSKTASTLERATDTTAPLPPGRPVSGTVPIHPRPLRVRPRQDHTCHHRDQRRHNRDRRCYYRDRRCHRADHPCHFWDR